MNLERGDHRHGTANGYNRLGCRCTACREAWTAYHREYMHRAGRAEPVDAYNDRRALLADLADNHGTEWRYKRGCRCDACRAAAAQCRRDRRHANIDATRAYERERWHREQRAEARREWRAKKAQP